VIKALTLSSIIASSQVLDIMKFYGDNMANGPSIQEGVFDKMKNAAGSNRSSGEEPEAGQPVSLSQAAEIAKAHGAENAFMAKYAHPVSVWIYCRPVLFRSD
jgi:hypothetical protein